jgi:hypothetical protein
MWWRGRQWAVTDHGIEALDGTYAIPTSRLVEDIDDHSWLAHMGEKSWVDTEDFATAWLVALAIFGVKVEAWKIRVAVRDATVGNFQPEVGARQ